MKSKNKISLSGYITLTFCVAVATLPFLALGGSNVADGFRCTFVTFPTNYLLYIAPVVLYFFLKKRNIAEKDNALILSAICPVIVVILHNAIQTNRNDIFFTLVATVVLAVVIININDSAANIVLLSGLIVLLSPTAYVFATYIPVLLLIFISVTAKNNQENKKLRFLFFAYLYIPVLILILFFAKKISFNIHPSYINFSNTKSMTELFSGMALLIIAAVMFIIRVIPIIKKGTVTQKLSLIIFAVYPFAIAVMNCFFNIISSAISNAILLSLIMYITGNIQISLSYKDNLPLIPQKIKNPVCLSAVLLIFCSFCFK